MENYTVAEWMLRDLGWTALVACIMLAVLIPLVLMLRRYTDSRGISRVKVAIGLHCVYAVGWLILLVGFVCLMIWPETFRPLVGLAF